MSEDTVKESPPRRKEASLPFVEPMFPKRLACGEAPVPGPEECAALWDKYAMLPNVRDHSEQVALVASRLGAMLEAAGANVHRPLVLAGGLLHDIAKTYTIKHGGSHAQLGAGWVVQETGNYQLAQTVYHHVHWPWELDVENETMLPSLLVLYADKRVKHSRIVTLEERFEDLMKRYGVTETGRNHILVARQQGLVIEKALSKRLGVAVDEYSFDCRRLV